MPTPGQTSSGGGENAAFIASQPQQVLYFGDFNGDGLQDVIETDADFLTGPTVSTAPNHYTLYVRFNTGNGFGPRIKIADTPWALGPLTGTNNCSYRRHCRCARYR